MKYAALSILALPFAAACASAPRPEPLTVAAAASLAPVLDELGEIYEQQTGYPVVFSYGATGSLAEQIRNGAPFDIFAAADAERVDALIAEGLLEQDTRLAFAQGVLVLVEAPELDLSLESVQDLANPSVRDVAIANPTHAPYGIAAAQSLRKSGVEIAVLPKLVYGESVRHAGLLVQSGNTDAGLIAKSIAENMDLDGLEVPQDLHDPIQHVAAILTNSSRHAQAVLFMQLLSSPEARAIYLGHGLISSGG